MTDTSLRIQRALEMSESVETAGYFQLLVRGRDRGWTDITMFRGMPVQLAGWSFADPFGPKDFSFTVPGVTIFDELGVGDLDWADPTMRIVLRWVSSIPLPGDYPYGVGLYDAIETDTGLVRGQAAFNGWNPAWRWTGNLASWHRSSDGLEVTAKGALYQLDDYLAKPEYPQRPIPYENAIRRQFRGKPHLRVGVMKIAWPSWWSKRYSTPGKGTPSYLVPSVVHSGNLWTGMLTFQTGTWDPVLSSYIQSMLSSMYTPRGRWTLDLLLDGPVLMHRDMYSSAPAHAIVIDATEPGFDCSLDEDFSQSLGVVYGAGVSLDGVTYSGMEVSGNGASTYYKPMASRRELDPVDDNDWLNGSLIRREVMLQMQKGLDEASAELVAREHLRRFGDPGVTGTITLRSDPHVNGIRIPKELVCAGMPVVIPGLMGRRQGLVAHVTDNQVNLEDGSNTLTIDTRWRDALTVKEVRLRGRNAMQIPRMLVAGQYTPPVPDQLVPWNYAKGSGYLPSGKEWNSIELFDGAPKDLEFPWESWTQRRPPSKARWRHCYMHIGAAQNIANRNWGSSTGTSGAVSTRLGFPIRAAQMATIRLIELAAYDKDGNVLPVAFHFSLYYVRGVSPMSMPRIPKSQDRKYGPGAVTGVYRKGDHYPFGKDAWEKYLPDGRLQDPNIPQASTTNGIIHMWGNFYDKAGYFPGSYSRGDSPTGMLRDETQFSIDTTNLTQTFDPRSKANDQPVHAGYIYAMIYCDEQQDQDVYFAGRMYRVEPGQEN